MPVFNLTLPRAVRAILERFPAETLAPGDVLITNDPWICAGHLFDVAIVTPVFRDGRVVAILGTIGHVTDIGGTRDSLSAREIYEEGFQIPPMKLYRAGAPNEDLFRLLAENVRKSEQVLGDLHALISANASGAQRLLAFMEEYGLEDLEALATVIQDRSERAMREAIRRVPDGTYRSEIWNDGLGTPLRYPVTVTVEGDEIDVDFAGAPPQQPRGGSNCTYNYTAAHTVYPLKCILSPGVPSNAGCYRPFRVTAPEGSILNCTKPASVNVRTRTGWYIAPNLFMALARAVPDRGPGVHRPPGFHHLLRPGRRTAASTATISSRGAARALPPRATASRRSSGRPAPPTRRSSCSRRGRRSWCSRSAISRTAAAPAGTAVASARSSACGSSPTTAGRPMPASFPMAC